jgi:hypothetical protein
MTFSCWIKAARPPDLENLIHPSYGGYRLAQIVFIHKAYEWPIRCLCFALSSASRRRGRSAAWLREQNSSQPTVSRRVAALEEHLSNYGNSAGLHLTDQPSPLNVLPAHRYHDPGSRSARAVGLISRARRGRFVEFDQPDATCPVPLRKNISVPFRRKSPAYPPPSRPTQRGVSRSSRT